MGLTMHPGLQPFQAIHRARSFWCRSHPDAVLYKGRAETRKGEAAAESKDLASRGGASRSPRRSYLRARRGGMIWRYEGRTQEEVLTVPNGVEEVCSGLQLRRGGRAVCVVRRAWGRMVAVRESCCGELASKVRSCGWGVKF